ncbi:MAG: hypothetical protein JOZ69_03585 [Myxococcales bacterium]|nr:hypothetical protein [Myxococcales bacterium]
MARPELPTNDGWKDIAYELGDSPEDNERIGAILNDACHVFRLHPEGTWREHDRDVYAGRLSKEIATRPGLVGRLLNTQDRVVKMITYRALELLKQAPTSAT